MTVMLQVVTSEPDAGEYVPNCARAWRDMAYIETGKWSVDCAQGRELGEELVEQMRETGSPLPLLLTVRGLMERQEWGAVEVGLLTTVAIRTLRRD
jgi:hypothetical protein